MAFYHADAIVIRTREYGEADKLLTLFAREKGKLEVIAKGARKPASKQRGGTQLFTYADFLIYKGKTLDLINQVHPKESFGHIWKDFDRNIAGTAMAELLDAATIREQPEPQVFVLFLSFLFLLEGIDPYLAQAAFSLRLMRLLGYLPDIGACLDCGESSPEKQYVLDAETGGILCLPCLGTRQGSGLGAGSLALMRQLLKTDLEKLDRLRWNSKMKEEVLQGLCFYCEGRFGRRLKAWRQGRQLRND
ncbi:DNA replication and repair protein RecO [Syntrophobotulus glycolicus DSM 8271]|uniref:DNA repair protein RecO n=1 Tax=Syntrophobotulus glycolicus (strain DSM 8271 / FlGlyR) TaxID=645991 RepID=F0SVD1_SYNGF|nr:DNA repair protein RecO [Syntrophobotulus glycolicus]ADY56704.1 DNA replication and repair protein RecO [Syntrophobotulus glycolicus DSM 8271]